MALPSGNVCEGILPAPSLLQGGNSLCRSDGTRCNLSRNKLWFFSSLHFLYKINGDDSSFYFSLTHKPFCARVSQLVLHVLAVPVLVNHVYGWTNGARGRHAVSLKKACVTKLIKKKKTNLDQKLSVTQNLTFKSKNLIFKANKTAGRFSFFVHTIFCLFKI